MSTVASNSTGAVSLFSNLLANWYPKDKSQQDEIMPASATHETTSQAVSLPRELPPSIDPPQSDVFTKCAKPEAAPQAESLYPVLQPIVLEVPSVAPKELNLLEPIILQRESVLVEEKGTVKPKPLVPQDINVKLAKPLKQDKELQQRRVTRSRTIPAPISTRKPSVTADTSKKSDARLPRV
jgi:hypothetical protein